MLVLVVAPEDGAEEEDGEARDVAEGDGDKVPRFGARRDRAEPEGATRGRLDNLVLLLAGGQLLDRLYAENGQGFREGHKASRGCWCIMRR